MKITDEDRALAREIAALFAEKTDIRTVNALAVVMWSHRQKPADGVSTDVGQARVSENQYAALVEAYQALSYRYGGTSPGVFTDPEDQKLCAAMHSASRALGRS